MKKKFIKTLQELFVFSKSSAAVTLVSEVLLGGAAVLVCILVFLALADNVIEKEVIFFDSWITSFIYTFRTTEMTIIMKGITAFGGEIIIGSAILATIVCLWRHHKWDAMMFSFILAMGIGLNFALKILFARPRPDLFPLIYESTHSFPSGHSMNSFMFYMALSYFIFHNTQNRTTGMFLTICSGILVLLIGISRIYLGAHYPSDVIAGYAAGLVWFGTVLLFEKTLIFWRLFQKHEHKKKY